jgi:hypothetical protein
MGPKGGANEARLRIDSDSNPQLGSPIITSLNGGTAQAAQPQTEQQHLPLNIVGDINEFLYRCFSIESSLAVNAISWSDNCAMASSFSLSRSLIAWLPAAV